MTEGEAIGLISRLLATFAGIEPESVGLDMKVSDDLGVDSLDAVELLITVERDTGIQFDEEALEGIVTVRDLVSRLVAASSASSADQANVGS